MRFPPRLIGVAFDSCHRPAHTDPSIILGSNIANYGSLALATILVFVVAQSKGKRRWKEMFVETL